jgi:hypothetical protein
MGKPVTRVAIGAIGRHRAAAISCPILRGMFGLP